MQCKLHKLYDAINSHFPCTLYIYNVLSMLLQRTNIELAFTFSTTETQPTYCMHENKTVLIQDFVCD